MAIRRILKHLRFKEIKEALLFRWLLAVLQDPGWRLSLQASVYF
jgi:hypothetical protein